jgi:hypothetical protein
MNDSQLRDAITVAYDALDTAAKALDGVRKIAPEAGADIIRKADLSDRTSPARTTPRSEAMSSAVYRATADSIETQIAALNARVDAIKDYQDAAARPFDPKARR